MMLTLILTGTLMLAFNIRLVKAQGVIYIRPDGSVEGTDKIQRDGNTYTFTDNIYDSIVVERNNTVIDGNGYTLQGPGASVYTDGINIYRTSNVTIKNMTITNWSSGVGVGSGAYAPQSTHNTISRNNITGNGLGIGIGSYGSNNTISDNSIKNNSWGGIRVGASPFSWAKYNTVSRNNITNNGVGVVLGPEAFYNDVSLNEISYNTVGVGIYGDFDCYNTFWENNITYNAYGISGFTRSSDNKVYHNNFIDNNEQVYSQNNWGPFDASQIWDDGYPSGGNYWSDYNGTDLYSGLYQNQTGSDGIGDAPYVIRPSNEYHQTAEMDNYPLMNPWTPTPLVVTVSIDIDPDTLNLRSKGKWITAYIQLPEGYNPEDIDASTILLNGSIQPVLDPKYSFVTNSSEYLVDHNNDGILERMLKFDRATLASFIYQRVGMQSDVPLTLTGKLADGTPFEGTDTVFVFWQGHRSPSKR
jgi:hypothetical protein